MTKKPKERGRRFRYGLGKTLAIMFTLGVVLTWASVFVIPTLIKLGVPSGPANKFPYVGFVAGMAWGASMSVSRGARVALRYVIAPPLVGAVFWILGVFAGGILLGFGLSEDAADYVPLIAFVLGTLLGAAPLLVKGAEWTHQTLGLDLRTSAEGDSKRIQLRDPPNE